MGCEDGDFVPSLLQSNRGVNHKAFGTTDPKIRMEEDNVSRLVR